MIMQTGHASAFSQNGDREWSHQLLAARELHEREDRERQLQAEDDLAQHQQRTRALFPFDRDDDDRGHDRDEPRDQPPQPRAKPDVEKSFHHDLPGQCAGERGVLPENSSATANSVLADGRTEQRVEQQVRVADVCDLAILRVRDGRPPLP